MDFFFSNSNLSRFKEEESDFLADVPQARQLVKMKRPFHFPVSGDKDLSGFLFCDTLPSRREGPLIYLRQKAYLLKE
jgi:hypothetical protein